MNLQLVKQPEREEMAAQLHFSYSQLNTYLMCPMKYGHNYVWNTPWETKPGSMCIGKAVHKAAEVYYRNLLETGEIVPVDQVISVFESVFDREIKNAEVEITLKNGQTQESIRSQGIELLKLFHKEVHPQKIVAIEFPFSVKVPDVINSQGDLPIVLVGYLDLIESDDERNYVVGELKTSAQKFSSLRLQYDLQSTVYSYAMTKMKVATSESSCLVRYDVLLKTKKPAFEQYFVTRTKSDYQRLIHLINHVLKAIENRIFYRQTGWQCVDCQFKKACFS